jgi:restriction system protein
MGRRKRKSPVGPQGFVGVLVALCILGVAAQLLTSRAFLEGAGSLLFVLVAMPVIYVIVLRYLRSEARRALLGKARAIVEYNIKPLTISREQRVRQDAYGMWQMGEWEKEKGRFIAQHIEPSLTARELAELRRDGFLVGNIIDARIARARQEVPAFRSFSDNITPPEFEQFCAEQLRRAGWSARVTSQSRDQGVDVVAEKGQVRIVLQCKLYAGPVGNKAVQEIAAGKAHERAAYGVVVSNSSFTRSAMQLASTNGILLLHYGDLQNLEGLLGR